MKLVEAALFLKAKFKELTHIVLTGDGGALLPDAPVVRGGRHSFSWKTTSSCG